MNVLITCAGRRVELLNLFRERVRLRNNVAKVYAADQNLLSAAVQLADGSMKTPHCGDLDYCSQILSFCQANNVKLVMPTIDTELEHFAAFASDFRRAGIEVNISSATAISIAASKVQSNKFFKKIGLKAPMQYDAADFEIALHELPFPWIIKPEFGSSSIGVYSVNSADEARFAISTIENPVIEQKIVGVEFTTNVFVDSVGKCVLAVPHQRIATRSGEVSKGVTVRDDVLLGQVEMLFGQLPGAFGILCAQCIRSHEGSYFFLEINARVGGGLPLAIAAGGPFLELLMGETFESDYLDSAWQEGLTMLRYDSSIFLEPAQMNGELKGI